MPSRSQFGRRLRRLRLARDITQERLAEQIGVSITFLGLVERGINAPSFETIERIGKALKVPVWQLFYLKGKTVDRPMNTHVRLAGAPTGVLDSRD